MAEPECPGLKASEQRRHRGRLLGAEDAGDGLDEMPHGAVPEPKERGGIRVGHRVERWVLLLEGGRGGPAELTIEEQNPELFVLETERALERREKGIDAFTVAAMKPGLAGEALELFLNVARVVLVTREEGGPAVGRSLVEGRRRGNRSALVGPGGLDVVAVALLLRGELQLELSLELLQLVLEGSLLLHLLLLHGFLLELNALLMRAGLLHHGVLQLSDDGEWIAGAWWGT